jgi:hypothetical protein
VATGSSLFDVGAPNNAYLVDASFHVRKKPNLKVIPGVPSFEGIAAAM